MIYFCPCGKNLNIGPTGLLMHLVDCIRVLVGGVEWAKRMLSFSEEERTRRVGLGR